jgi:hypothetical protein
MFQQRVTADINMAQLALQKSYISASREALEKERLRSV